MFLKPSARRLVAISVKIALYVSVLKTGAPGIFAFAGSPGSIGIIGAISAFPSLRAMA
jgi:hypothetical protein